MQPAVDFPTPHRFTVAEYMTLDIPEQTELVAGVVYDVSPRNEPHRYAVAVLNRALTRGLRDEYMVRVQDAVAVSGWTGNDAPEIDIAVLAYRFYQPVPTAADAYAFIEVSDSTYRDDRNVKVPLYVRAGVPTWIVNIARRQVEFYGSAADLAIDHGRVFADGETFEVLNVAIAVRSLFEIAPRTTERLSRGPFPAADSSTCRE